MSNNIHFHYERDIDQGSEDRSETYELPRIRLYRPSGGLTCQLEPSRNIQLDRNNSLDLRLSTGWNEVTSCDVRIRPNTGGLRLLTTEVKFVSDGSSFAQPPESGLFRFGTLQAGSTIELRFPFSTEQDVASISVKIDITYVTNNGTYTYSLTPSVAVSLDLGVNVQDVFKHTAIFSRFSVSTASPSPLVLSKSELLASDIFDSSSGYESGSPITVFPKQPATLLYKISRNPEVTIGSKTKKTMYLKLQYTVVLDTIVAHAVASLRQAFNGKPVARYEHLLTAYVKEQISSKLSPYDLERAALLNEVTTSCLSGPHLVDAFRGLGTIPGTGKLATSELVACVQDWQKAHPKIPLHVEGIEKTRSILIPVDIPTMPILYSVDIQLDQSLAAPVYGDVGGTTAEVNQLLSANLQIQWTRLWNTSTEADLANDFSYEVTAPPDMWLVGGQRRGHITTSVASAGQAPPSSTLNVPLMLVPLREGRLPYPTIEIREASADDEGASWAQGHCETDYRNLGETVHVVADRRKVTLNLDSSGPGGGPLVLESERRVLEGRVVV